MADVLLLIDIQNDYFPGGRMELEGSEKAGQAAARLLDACRTAQLPVVHIQHVSTRPGASFFLPDTPGVDIHACVAPRLGESVLIKHFPSAFRETPLVELLRSLGAQELLLAGMMTHMCVDSTVRAAFDLGYSCILAHDACATRELRFQSTLVEAWDVQAAYLAALDGLFARVRSVDEITPHLAVPLP